MSNTHDLPEELRPIRVLFIVDSLYWGIGNFALQMKKGNPRIDAIICSEFSIRKTVKRFGSFPSSFDVIHCLAPVPLKFFWGQSPIVTTLHHVDSEKDFKTNIGPFKKSDAVMTVSSQWLNHLKKQCFPHEKLGLVPFGVDTNSFRPPKEAERLEIREALAFNEQDIIVGFTGKSTSNLNGRKGLDCFTKAIKNFHLRVPNVKALIIGPGWQNFARTLNTEGIACTYFPYQIEHREIAKWYRAMDIFWVTAKIEGGPVPLLEAMASGLPCISTPVGVALDLIENERNGFIVPFNNAEEFAKISLHILNDNNLKKRIGDEARHTIIQKRQWKQSQEKLENLYKFAIKNFHIIQETKTSPFGGPEPLGFEKKIQSEEPLQVLEFSSSKVQNWMKACEEINGFKMMVKMREWKAASRFGFQALRTTPFDPSLWREIISVLLKSRKSTPPQPMYDVTQTLLTPK